MDREAGELPPIGKQKGEMVEAQTPPAGNRAGTRALDQLDQGLVAARYPEPRQAR